MENLAPKPKFVKSGIGTVIYNVMLDNGNKPVTPDDIWKLMPPAFHKPYCKGKVKKALVNMTQRGVLIYANPEQKNSQSRLLVIADKAHYDSRTPKRVRKSADRKKVSRKKKGVLTQTYENVVVMNGVARSIDAEIERLEKRVVDLRAFREMAIELGL